MAFWLERILSSKRLVCNRMQTGPVSSLPSPWQLSKRLRSRPHNCARSQGCRGALWEPPGLRGIRRRAALWDRVYTIQKCGPELRNMEQAWEDLEGAALSSCTMRISPLLLSGPPRLQSRTHFLASGRQACWHGTVPWKEAFFLKW